VLLFLLPEQGKALALIQFFLFFYQEKLVRGV